MPLPLPLPLEAVASHYLYHPNSRAAVEMLRKDYVSKEEYNQIMGVLSSDIGPGKEETESKRKDHKAKSKSQKLILKAIINFVFWR